MTKPPTAKSGKTYKTVAERCAACEVYGGEEKPCISTKESKRMQAQHGRPCPSVVLDLSNDLAARLAISLFSETTRAAAPFQALLHAFSIDDARTALDRAVAAVRSKAVNDAMKATLPEPSAAPPKAKGA